MSDSLNNTSATIISNFAEQIETIRKFADNNLEVQKSNIESQDKFNSDLLNKMSESLNETTSKIITAFAEQCSILQESLKNNIGELEKSYKFISDKSASIIANYEQSSEAYNDAVQNAHNLNESFGKAIAEMNVSLKEISKTNSAVENSYKLMEASEGNIEAIIMRVEELGKAIVTLQQLEMTLKKIATR